MMMKTRDYKIFKFREDNRESVNEYDVTKLMERIKKKNMLNMRPILINKDMEILDGQHRLCAAERLGLDIYYVMNEDLTPEDIISLNTNVGWKLCDYMNFYIKHNYPEYLKLHEFMKKHNLTLRLAMKLTMPGIGLFNDKFKNGQYIFTEAFFKDKLEFCMETIASLRQLKGNVGFIDATKFWKALINLSSHENFDYKRWKNNLEKHVNRIGPRVSDKEYYAMFVEIYNYRTQYKIPLIYSDRLSLQDETMD